MQKNEIKNFPERNKNLTWYLPKLIYQTRCDGAEHVNIWKSFLSIYSHMRLSNSIRPDPIIFKIH